MESGEKCKKHKSKKAGRGKKSLDLAYESLSESARRLFAQISFFPGGLFRNFADLWELLGDEWEEYAEEITQKKLAKYDKSTDRYALIPKAQKYASKKLDEGDGDNFRQRTTSFWAEFTRWYDFMLDVQIVDEEEEEKKLHLPDDPEERQEALEALRSNSFAMMISEQDNVVHSAQWALKAGDETGLGIVDSLEDYLELRKQWQVMEQLYQLALSQRRKLAANKPDEYMSDVAGTLNSLGRVLTKVDRLDSAKSCFLEALRIYRQLSQSAPEIYTPETATALANIGTLYSQTDFPDEGLAYYKEALEIYREFFDQYPAAYGQKLLNTFKGAMKVYEKLGMKEVLAECREEIEKIEQLLS